MAAENGSLETSGVERARRDVLFDDEVKEVGSASPASDLLLLFIFGREEYFKGVMCAELPARESLAGVVRS